MSRYDPAGWPELRTRLLQMADEYPVPAIDALATHGPTLRTKADVLREHPELFERAFWRIFHVADEDPVPLTNIDGYTPDGTASWQETVVELVEDGTAQRGRVLDSVLVALQRSPTAYAARWFSQLHKAMRPSVDEVAVRQEAYGDLLQSTVGNTVSLALTTLAPVGKAGRLDASVLNGLSVAVEAPAKSTALGALRLAVQLAARPAVDREAVLAVLKAGLAHPNADVQSFARAQVTALGGAAAPAGRPGGSGR